MRSPKIRPLLFPLFYCALLSSDFSISRSFDTNVILENIFHFSYWYFWPVCSAFINGKFPSSRHCDNGLRDICLLSLKELPTLMDEKNLNIRGLEFGNTTFFIGSLSPSPLSQINLLKLTSNIAIGREGELSAPGVARLQFLLSLSWLWAGPGSHCNFLQFHGLALCQGHSLEM